jgi:hypothetical protein
LVTAAFGSDLGCLTRRFAYRDKKVVGVFVHFRAPLHVHAGLPRVNVADAMPMDPP